jgi:squalene-hopene/tetraprenyl-beta-curcumene cyclase
VGVHEAERTEARPEGAEASELDRVLDAAAARLLDLQTPGGWWVGELESNVTMTAQHVFLLHFLRRLDERTLRGCANELLARQRADGTWAIYWGGEPDLAATVEAYAALRLAGLPADDPRLAGARAFVLDRGGVGASRVFTRMWLALLGQWRWEDIPQIPAELIFLRSSMPFSVYDFACWARQTLVPLAVAMHYRPVRPVPADRRCDELNLGVLPRRNTPIDWGDALLTRYQNGRTKPGRERALDLAERWILDRQELDGSWGGIQPPWVWSLVALVCRGHGPGSPYLERGIAGWRRFMVEDGDRIRPEACQSPVWDTGLAVLALRAAGVPAGHDALRRAAGWLRGEEVRTRSDWSLRRPGATAGGWSFEYDNDLYPDIDDAAVVGLALEEADAGGEHVERSAAWIAAMQSAGGGWGAFDADNRAEWLYGLPFCDFGFVIDPPSVDVTGHALELLAGRPGHEEAVRRGVEYVLAEQEEDGSWYGRWGVNYVYGVGAALPALAAVGIPPEHEAVRRAVAWLESVQNEDGGFGEDCRSYDLGEAGLAWRGRGTSTASQTAFALLALVAAGEAGSPVARRAVRFLAETQRPDGDWNEEHFTGTGFPRDFMIRYHLYRIVWPVLALGRVRQALAPS